MVRVSKTLRRSFDDPESGFRTLPERKAQKRPEDPRRELAEDAFYFAF
jgi:hypothetical protein